MLPKTNYKPSIILNNEKEIISTTDYKINFNNEQIQGKINDLQSMAQTVFMILNTQRKAYSMYDLSYGTDLEQYIGKDLDYITMDLPREVKESLTKDKRILDVTDFAFTQNKENLYVEFTVRTIYGELQESTTIEKIFF